MHVSFVMNARMIKNIILWELKMFIRILNCLWKNITLMVLSSMMQIFLLTRKDVFK